MVVPVEVVWRVLWTHYTPLRDDSSTVGIAKGAILQNVLLLAGALAADSITQRLGTLFIHRAVPLVFLDLMTKKQKASNLMDETQSVYFLRHLTPEETAAKAKAVPPMPEGFKASLKTELREVLMGRKSAQQLVAMASTASRNGNGKRAATMPAEETPAAKRRKIGENGKESELPRASTTRSRRQTLEPDSGTLVIDDGEEETDEEGEDADDEEEDKGDWEEEAEEEEDEVAEKGRGVKAARGKAGGRGGRQKEANGRQESEAAAKTKGRGRPSLGSASMPKVMSMPSSFATVDASGIASRSFLAPAPSSLPPISRAASAVPSAVYDSNAAVARTKADQELVLLRATIGVMQQEMAAIREKQKQREEQWATIFSALSARVVTLEDHTGVAAAAAAAATAGSTAAPSPATAEKEKENGDKA